LTGMLQDYVIRQGGNRPEAVAIVNEGKATTYGQLDSLSSRLARVLKKSGCRRGDRVAFLLPKSEMSLAAMTGILKADCAYVPMDCQAPVAYAAKLISRVEPRVALVDRTYAAFLPRLLETLGSSAPLLGWLDTDSVSEHGLSPAFDLRDVMNTPDAPVEYENSPDDVAHILFTSGSTGVPKGVMITHRNVTAFVEWAVPYFGMDSSDRISTHSHLHFDLSTFDVYGAFAAGARLYPVPPSLGLSPGALTGFIRESEITQWLSAPWVFHYLARLDALRDRDFPAMRRMMWAGDVLPTPTLVYWMRKAPHVSFTNLYGPTETTIASSYYTVPACPEDEREPVPIGVACDGEELLVLNGQLRRSPAGEIGDLYIGGVGLSPGYWGDPEKTREVFIPHPFAPGTRLYKTGDLARRGEDGLIHFVGRADTQVKIRGARVELGEIECALHLLDYLADSAVVAVAAGPSREYAICCAYSPSPGEDVPPARVHRDLLERLPRIMIPTRWLSLDALPRNTNGKTDRPKLRVMFSPEGSSSTP